MSRHRSHPLFSTLGLRVGATCALAVPDDLQCFTVTNETLKKLRAVVLPHAQHRPGGECYYSDLGDNAARAVAAGDSVATDEVCMALGFFFPSTGPVFC